MRLREVFRYEFLYRVQSASTWVHALFLFLIMFMRLSDTGAGQSVDVNAPQQIAEYLVLFGGLFGLMATAALFGDAAIRDTASGMDPLLYTTPLTKSEYLAGRFLAAFAVNALVALAIPLGCVAAILTIVDPGALGPFRLAAYMQPLLLFSLPNLALAGAILFTIGSIARHVIPVYLGAAAILIGYVVAANYWTDIDSPILSVLADPLGINALLAMTRYWTPTELDNRLVGFPALLLWNRLLWLTIAAALLAWLHHRFRFSHGEQTGRTRQRTAVAAPATAPLPAVVPRLSGEFGQRTRRRQILAIARQSLVEATSGRTFQVALVGAVGLVLLWGWNVGDTAFDTPTWPVTRLIVGEVLSLRSILIPLVLLALYAGELVWKDREVAAAEIADATPVPTVISWLGRFLALVVIVVLVHAATMLGGLLVQTLQGYYNYEPGLYVRVVFGLNLAEHVLFAAFAMTVHVLVNQKHVGHLVVLASFALTRLGGALGLPSLALFNSDPGWQYSDMNGFGPFLGPFIWFKLYWATWALLLGVVAVLFWVRGREAGVRTRLAIARARFNGPTVRTASVAVALILAVGGFIFYNTHILNANPSPDEAGRSQAEYERRYGRHGSAPQPTIVAADLRVELYPDASAADIRGRYRLVNRSANPIRSVHVLIDSDVDARSITFDRQARPVVDDSDVGYHIFELEQALATGDALLLSFELAFHPRGFRSSGIHTAVVENGTYIDRRLLPFIGYQPLLELTDEGARERFGLEPRPATPNTAETDPARVDGAVRNEGDVHVQAIIGTAADQTAVFSGMLRRSWTENGRRYFEYDTEGPLPFGASVLSARYAVREDQWQPPRPDAGAGVTLRIFHHPAHTRNLDRMMAGMKAALDYYTEAFGPYQFRELRVAEVPPYGINGRALATTILFAEQNFLTRADGNRVDHTFFGTAHEVAHSWWGGQLRGANVPGRAFLSEGLSNYSAMMVTERVMGPAEARRVYEFQLERYLSRRRAFQRDVPLIEVEDHPHIAYGKGAIVMYQLREQLGEATVNRVLRGFLEKHRRETAAGSPDDVRAQDRPGPAVRDLLAELRAVTPESKQYLLTDLFETVTLWDVETRRATVRRTSDGQYEVALDVNAKKLRADAVGRESEVPMDDWVEIGVFGADGGDSPLYLERHRIRSGEQTIRLTVPAEPASAGIDPRRTLIDRDPANNVVNVQPAEPVTDPAGGQAPNQP